MLVCVQGVGIEETSLEERAERRRQNDRPGGCFPALRRAWVQGTGLEGNAEETGLLRDLRGVRGQ